MTDELVRLTARDGAVKTTPVVAAEPEPDAPVDPLRAPVAGIGDNSAVTIDEELKRLAKEINASHASAVKSVDNAITDSLTTGVKLIEARNKVKHGEWTSWVEANLSFGLRRVQQYIQMVERKYAINGDSLLDICLMITRYDREHPVTSAPVEVKSEETSLIAPTEVETKIQVKTAETTRELRSGTPQRKGPAPTCKISYAEHQRQLKNAIRQGIEQEDKRKEDSSAYEEFIKVLLELMKRDGYEMEIFMKIIQQVSVETQYAYIRLRHLLDVVYEDNVDDEETSK